jgi:predicted nucleic acid-binding protein
VSFLIDTSAIVHLLRDASGGLSAKYDAVVADEDVFLSELTAFELLRGARDRKEWDGLMQLIEGEKILGADHASWLGAARIVFDLRRKGATLKNSIDCLIAETALRHDLTVVHDDGDFETIARVRPLKLVRFRAGT